MQQYILRDAEKSRKDPGRIPKESRKDPGWIPEGSRRNPGNVNENDSRSTSTTGLSRIVGGSQAAGAPGIAF